MGNEIKENNIEQIILPLHGTLRNGEEYYSDLCKSIKEKLEQTLIVAPNFKRVDDERENDEFYWGKIWYEKWKYGYQAQNAELSSFDIMDNLVQFLDNKNKYPKLKRIILIGHSAGGQFVQRFAAGSQINSDITSKLHLVVSNPSSYLYLHPERINFINNDFESFLPNDSNCDEYDNYIYGLEKDLPPYLEKFSKKEIQQIYARNPVIYLMGEEDKDLDLLDRSCEANFQGKNRIDRAYNFFQYIRKYFPENKHYFYSVPKVGHDHLKIFQSTAAQDIFFGNQIPQNLIVNKIGNQHDFQTKTKSSFILLGGGKNESTAFKYLLQETNGGDLVVLSTKDYINHRYTHYLWKLAEENNIPLNSVTTISTKNFDAANLPFVTKMLQKADGIFLTGGDQFRYQNYWKNSELLKNLNQLIQAGIPLAGSSAGLAIMGEFYFSAENGTIVSDEALKNPESSKIIIEKDLLVHPRIKNIITDTHFSERHREGRLVSFLNRIEQTYQSNPIGIGVDENTSLIISENSTTKTGNGHAFLYKKYSAKGLNFGPIQKIELIENKIYPQLSEIKEPNNIINVVNGKIIPVSETPNFY